MKRCSKNSGPIPINKMNIPKLIPDDKMKYFKTEIIHDGPIYATSEDLKMMILLIIE